MENNKFVAVVNCMDGRVQLPVNDWLRHKFTAVYMDTITEPGPVKILAEATDIDALTVIKECLDVSINKHKAEAVAIVAHADCAGNPVSQEEQIREISLAKEQIRKWYAGMEIIGLWVNDSWQVEEV